MACSFRLLGVPGNRNYGLGQIQYSTLQLWALQGMAWLHVWCRRGRSESESRTGRCRSNGRSEQTNFAGSNSLAAFLAGRPEAYNYGLLWLIYGLQILSPFCGCPCNSRPDI